MKTLLKCNRGHYLREKTNDSKRLSASFIQSQYTLIQLFAVLFFCDCYLPEYLLQGDGQERPLGIVIMIFALDYSLLYFSWENIVADTL